MTFKLPSCLATLQTLALVVKVYYELHLLKLKNCLHVKVTCFHYHCFQGKLTLPSLQLTTTNVKGDTLIEH